VEVQVTNPTLEILPERIEIEVSRGPNGERLGWLMRDSSDRKNLAYDGQWLLFQSFGELMDEMTKWLRVH
jgi:hypothetical protein